MSQLHATVSVQRAHADTKLTPPPLLRDLAALAGVSFNGPNPWDIRVHDAALYRRILKQPALGLGEAYMDGLWDCDQLDELFCRIFRADLEHRLPGLYRLRGLAAVLRDRLVNRQSPSRAFEVGQRHYDIGNDVFEAMLDSSMSYSCGYWKEARDLEEAQQAKLRLICDKLQLTAGLRLLDIGCGWGGLARFAAEHYGVEVFGITVSREQAEMARQRCRGLPVQIALQDYRAVRGHFDRVVSVGMFEHVGVKNYRAYFEVAARCLSDDGLFLLHTIGTERTGEPTDAWTDRYIFPNGYLPSALEITKAVEGRLAIEDWHNFGADYDPTLMAWWAKFEAAWRMLSVRYDQRFYRMWKYYLHASAGLFRSRVGQLWQIALAKRGYPGAYRSVR